MSVEALSIQARNSISTYCIEECGAYCCRKGFLTLSSRQVDAVLNGRKEELIKSQAVTLSSNTFFSLNLTLANSCPSLQNNLCIIHESSERPKVCQDYPLFVIGRKIIFSHACPAVRSGKFYIYEKEFIKMGFSIE